jgi:hypothetical protein
MKVAGMEEIEDMKGMKDMTGMGDMTGMEVMKNDIRQEMRASLQRRLNEVKSGMD